MISADSIREKKYMNGKSVHWEIWKIKIAFQSWNDFNLAVNL